VPRIRSTAYRQVAFLDIHHAEYQAGCGRHKVFLSWPLDIPGQGRLRRVGLPGHAGPPAAGGLNAERSLATVRRDFLLDPSAGFVHDCLGWELARLDLPARRARTPGRFSGPLCVDGSRLGRLALLLATDPLADEAVGFALVGANDQAHLRRFLLLLKHWGFLPSVVLSDGSSLYPALLAE
jgi:hypothetical protein